MENFKVGDVVRLKSLSPQMTIKEIKGNIATCVWIDKDGTPYERDYPLNLLDLD